ncbi:GntR family transcriptional regulator [Streptomyces sp. NPDC048639]|uniref:GntR family transcriptional regulator n=1 Tax=Streptomyces sp. NPDC048639 TaxID=3365581 RepID=UPI00371444B8
MTPKIQRSAPPFIQITDHFREKITDGSLPKGSQLPSIAAIASEWGVASATAAKAIKQLQAEGYVRSTSQGTFVDLGRKQTTGPDRLQMLRVGGDGFRPGERVEILSAELMPAPIEVAQALEVEEGASVIRRQRRYLDDEGVVALSTSWLPGEFAESAPELIAAEPLPKMTFGLVEDRTGRRAVRRRDVVSLRSVPEDAAPLLEVEAGTAVLTMANHYWDQNGSKTEYATDFLGAGRELSAEYDLT